MGKGFRNYISISQGVKEVENNNSLLGISNSSSDFIKSLENYRDQLTDITDENDSTIDQLEESLENDIKRFQEETLKYEKSLNKSLKILSNKIDKSIDWDLDSIYQYQNINDDLDLMIRAIVMDFLYQGKFNEAKALVDVSEIDNFDLLVNHFTKLKDMIKLLYKEDYTPIFEWIMDNERKIFELSEIRSDLTSLIYFQVLEIKANKGIEIPPHGNLILNAQNEKDNRLLLRIRNYFSSLEESIDNLSFTATLPEIGIFDKEKIKDKVNKELIRLYNKLSNNVQNLQTESPLYKCLLAGHFALGILVKYNTITRRKSSSSLGNLDSEEIISRRRSMSTSIGEIHPLINRMRGLHTHLKENTDNSTTLIFNSATENTIDELPMEFELPKWMGFHKIFICPILKEETTSKNRPYVLPCRHFISEQALTKLAKGLSDEIKCPYCPSRASWRDAHEVKFIAL